jgi:threonine dehydrogenase-like Zn-dependent dehydrogenase
MSNEHWVKEKLRHVEMEEKREEGVDVYVECVGPVRASLWAID